MKPRVRASALCRAVPSPTNTVKWLVVRLRDPHTGKIYRMPPGGAIAPDESAAQAAEREAWEETGFHVVVNPQTEKVVEYDFFWDGNWVPCKTYFFIGEIAEQKSERPQAASPQGHETFLEGYEWLGTDQLLESLKANATLHEALAPWIHLNDRGY